MSEAMRHRAIEVVAGDNGARVPAELVECAACGSAMFFIYLVAGTNTHLQCVQCGTSYCQHPGPCSGQHEGGVYDPARVP